MQVSGVINQSVKFVKVIRPYLGIKYAHNQLLEKLTGISRGVMFIAAEYGPASKAMCLIFSFIFLYVFSPLVLSLSKIDVLYL